MSSTIVHSGTTSNKSPRYEYVYSYDSSVVYDKKKAKAVILFVVRTSMAASAYKDLAAKCVTGQSTVFVTVDNRPGNPVKLSGKQTADAFNDIAANVTERLGDFVSSSPTIFVGGHSAGGFSAIEAMKVNDGNLNFEPAGFIGADPVGRNVNINTLKINCPTFAIGFTVETCKVKLPNAGAAAYNVAPSSNRVMMQIQNPTDRGNQITHCIFAEDGCLACPSHEAGAWVRQVIANFANLFINSIVKGANTAKRQYENATGDNKSLVNVFYGTETATVDDGSCVIC